MKLHFLNMNFINFTFSFLCKKIYFSKFCLKNKIIGENSKFLFELLIIAFYFFFIFILENISHYHKLKTSKNIYSLS